MSPGETINRILFRVLYRYFSLLDNDFTVEESIQLAVAVRTEATHLNKFIIMDYDGLIGLLFNIIYQLLVTAISVF